MVAFVKNPNEVRARTDSYTNRTDQSQPLYQLSQILIFVLLLTLRLYNFVFTVVKLTMPSYQKLQCRLTAPYILVACDGGLKRKKINTDDHLSMCNHSGGIELDKEVKFRISRSEWRTFSRVERIRRYVPRENEHRGAHFRGCTHFALVHVYPGGTKTLLHRLPGLLFHCSSGTSCEAWTWLRSKIGRDMWQISWIFQIDRPKVLREATVQPLPKVKWLLRGSKNRFDKQTC